MEMLEHATRRGQCHQECWEAALAGFDGTQILLRDPAHRWGLLAAGILAPDGRVTPDWLDVLMVAKRFKSSVMLASVSKRRAFLTQLVSDGKQSVTTTQPWFMFGEHMQPASPILEVHIAPYQQSWALLRRSLPPSLRSASESIGSVKINVGPDPDELSQDPYQAAAQYRETIERDPIISELRRAGEQLFVTISGNGRQDSFAWSKIPSASSEAPADLYRISENGILRTADGDIEMVVRTHLNESLA